MVRLWGIASLACALTALAVLSAKAQPHRPMPAERHLIVQEPNKQAQHCRVLKCWKENNGTRICQVQALDTGEIMTIVEGPAQGTPGVSQGMNPASVPGCVTCNQPGQVPVPLHGVPGQMVVPGHQPGAMVVQSPMQAPGVQGGPLPGQVLGQPMVSSDCSVCDQGGPILLGPDGSQTIISGQPGQTIYRWTPDGKPPPGAPNIPANATVVAQPTPASVPQSKGGLLGRIFGPPTVKQSAPVVTRPAESAGKVVVQAPVRSRTVPPLRTHPPTVGTSVENDPLLRPEGLAGSALPPIVDTKQTVVARSEKLGTPDVSGKPEKMTLNPPSVKSDLVAKSLPKRDLSPSKSRPTLADRMKPAESDLPDIKVARKETPALPLRKQEPSGPTLLSRLQEDAPLNNGSSWRGEPTPRVPETKMWKEPEKPAIAKLPPPLPAPVTPKVEKRTESLVARLESSSLSSSPIVPAKAPPAVKSDEKLLTKLPRPDDKPATKAEATKDARPPHNDDRRVASSKKKGYSTGGARKPKNAFSESYPPEMMGMMGPMGMGMPMGMGPMGPMAMGPMPMGPIPMPPGGPMLPHPSAFYGMPQQPPMMPQGMAMAGPVYPQPPMIQPPMNPIQPVVGYASVSDDVDKGRAIATLRDSILPSEREYAADQLSRLNWRSEARAVQALTHGAQHDPAPMVRVSCIQALVKMRANTMPVVQAVGAARQDKDVRVRTVAEDAYGVLSRP